MFVSSPNSVFHFTEVASRLGYDNLDDITREDMTLEVIIFYSSILLPFFFVEKNSGLRLATPSHVMSY